MDTSTRCQSCRRPVWSARSIETGRGSGCRASLALVIRVAAGLPQFSPAQLDRARELIELGAIVPAGYGGVFRAVSSDGTRTYWTSPRGCTCPATVTCYHQVAAAILTAAR